MKWKLFMRKLSISAPRMTVRSQFPLPVRALLGFIVLALAAAAGVAIYEYGRQFAGPDRRDLQIELERTQLELREARAERDRYSATATALESQLKIERASQAQLGKQVSQLEMESNRLRDDLAFFESLLPTKPGAKGVVVRSFRMQPEEGQPTQMRYRILVQQSGKPERDFVGSVQLQVNLVQGGRSITMQLPDPADDAASRALDLSFRHYQRVEGTFAIPSGAVARSVLVRILAAGQTHAQQSFSL